MPTRSKRQGLRALPTELLARALGHLSARERCLKLLLGLGRACRGIAGLLRLPLSRRRASNAAAAPILCRAIAETVCRRWRRVLTRPDVFGGVVDAQFLHDRSAALPAFCTWLCRRLGGPAAANLAAARPPRPLPLAELRLQLTQPPNAADAATHAVALAMLLGAAGHRLSCLDLQLSPVYRPRGGGSSGSLQLDLLCLPLTAATRLAIQATAIDLSDGLAHLTSLRELCLEYDSLTSRVGAPACSGGKACGGSGTSPYCASSSSTASSSGGAAGCGKELGCWFEAPQPLLRLPTGLTRIELLGSPEAGVPQPLAQLRCLLAARHSGLLDLDLSYNTPASCDELAGLAHLTRLQRLAWRGTAGWERGEEWLGLNYGALCM